MENHNQAISGIHFISILLEQSQNTISQIRQRTKICVKIIVFFWLFTTLVISNCYKSVLFSLLAKPSLPQVPHSVFEIADFKFPVITISWLTTYETGDLPLSLASIKFDEIIRTHSKISVRLYSELSKELRFYPVEDVSEFFVAMSELQELKDGRSNLTSKIPSEFIFFDNISEMDFLTELTRLLSEDKLVLAGSELSLFSTRRQWVIRRNYLNRLIRPYLKGVVESGIFQRWEKFHEIHDQFWKMNRTLSSANGNNDESGKIMAYLMGQGSKLRILRNKEPEPMSLTTFEIFGKLFLYCCGFGAFIFILEAFGFGSLKKFCVYCGFRQF